MLIEAAKGGHTNVVQLLLDYPHSVMLNQQGASMLPGEVGRRDSPLPTAAMPQPINFLQSPPCLSSTGKCFSKSLWNDKKTLLLDWFYYDPKYLFQISQLLYYKKSQKLYGSFRKKKQLMLTNKPPPVLTPQPPPPLTNSRNKRIQPPQQPPLPQPQTLSESLCYLHLVSSPPPTTVIWHLRKRNRCEHNRCNCPI